MYTLRVMNESGCQNHALGGFYSSTNRFENPEKFRAIFKEMFKREHVADLDGESDSDTKNIIGFIKGSNDYTVPIYQTDDNYIMTDSGTTFERLNKSMTRRRIIKGD